MGSDVRGDLGHRLCVAHTQHTAKTALSPSMLLLISLSAVVQVCLIYHVYRTGRPLWWAFVILSIPVVGSLLYYALELLPATGGRAGNVRVEEAPAAHLLEKKLAALALCPSVANKLAPCDAPSFLTSRNSSAGSQ